MSESKCIITSLNLYEFSQINNNEMGVLLDKEDECDKETYTAAYEEAQRLIRISDEIRLTAKIVDQNPLEEQEASKELMLTSYKIANKLNVKTAEFLSQVEKEGYIIKQNDIYVLTDKGNQLGAVSKSSKQHGQYFLWPADFKN
ncbi:hypothetical protein [Thorsellia kenyensis]|uniref:Uncharacterized protein n=1 Tax=Thorsellia kenyensis TaxID=1549888 RepID=A0ABV6CD57_9GAMM